MADSQRGYLVTSSCNEFTIVAGFICDLTSGEPADCILISNIEHVSPMMNVSELDVELVIEEMIILFYVYLFFDGMYYDIINILPL